MRFSGAALTSLILGAVFPASITNAAAPKSMQEKLASYKESLSEMTVKTTFSYTARTFHPSEGIVASEDGESLEVKLDHVRQNGKLARVPVELTPEYDRPFERAKAQFTVYTQGEKKRIEYSPNDLDRTTTFIYDGNDYLTRTETEEEVRESIVREAEPSMKHFSPLSYVAQSSGNANSKKFNPVPNDEGDQSEEVVLEYRREEDDTKMVTVTFTSQENPALLSMTDYSRSGEVVYARRGSDFTIFQGIPLHQSSETINYKAPGKPEVIINISNIKYEKVTSPAEDLFTVEKSSGTKELKGMERVHLEEKLTK